MAEEASVAGLTVHRLRVTLLDVEPSVWRLLRVPSALPLSVVHGVLQIGLGWQDAHLHEWRAGELTFGLPDEPNWGEELGDESAVTLAEVAPADGVLHYDYDFGDGWRHVVVVESIEPYHPEVAPLACLAGSGACPPEDSGGPIGYEHLLDAWADADDVEHDVAVEVLGADYDAGAFDVGRVNQELEQLWRTI